MQERNSCPVCGSFDLEFKCSYTSKESADIFCPPFRNEDRNKRLISAIENLWNQDHCKVYQCKDCTFGFAIPFIGGNEEYYEILHEQMGYPSWRWEYDAAISSLTSKKSARILDIGAGEGNFLSKFPEDYDLNAIESSDLTINELSKKGISGYKSIEDKKEEWRDSFDCVTLFQVLEHISEFKDIIEDAKYILKTGGKFIVSVPNADDMFEQERILNHPDMPPNHINKWSVKSLSIALKNSGFKVIHHMHEKNQGCRSTFPSPWRAQSGCGHRGRRCIAQSGGWARGCSPVR